MSHIDDLVRMVWDKVRWYLDHEYRPVLVRAAGALSANTVPTAAIVAGAVTPDRLAAGGTTPSASTFYRGDGTWQPVSGSGTTRWVPLSNGDPAAPELIFDALGQVVVVEETI